MNTKMTTDEFKDYFKQIANKINNGIDKTVYKETDKGFKFSLDDESMGRIDITFNGEKKPIKFKVSQRFEQYISYIGGDIRDFMTFNEELNRSEITDDDIAESGFEYESLNFETKYYKYDQIIYEFQIIVAQFCWGWGLSYDFIKELYEAVGLTKEKICELTNLDLEDD